MEKTSELFDAWNEQKKKVEFNVTRKTIDVKIGEFRRYRAGVNIGNEISKDGKFLRVGFIVKNNLGNGLVLVAPLTTKFHHRMKSHYILIRMPEKYGLRKSYIILNQLLCIDKKRFLQPTGSYRHLIGLSKKVRHIYKDMLS